MTAKEQNKLAGIFLLVHGSLQAVMMLFLCLIYGGVGGAMFFSARKQEEQFVGLAFVAIILFVALFSVIFVIPQIIGGWKLLKESPNARTWAIIGSMVSCMSFPLGTAAGVFGLVFLFGESGKQFYLGGMNQHSFGPPQPPPPSSWQ